jgi:hypothetical protein
MKVLEFIGSSGTIKILIVGRSVILPDTPILRERNPI